MVVWSAWGAQSCLALAEECRVGYGPWLQLPEPWGRCWLAQAQRWSPGSGWHLPRLARALGLLTDCRVLIRQTLDKVS